MIYGLDLITMSVIFYSGLISQLFQYKSGRPKSVIVRNFTAQSIIFVTFHSRFFFCATLIDV